MYSVDASPCKGQFAQAASAAFGKLPDAIARDPSYTAEELSLLAYALTFKNWGLNVTNVGRAFASGMGPRVFYKALQGLKAKGAITREIQPKTGRGRGFALDTVHITAEGKKHRRVERRWFDGSRSVKAMAVVLFVRSQGKYGASATQLRSRFRWSLPTVRQAAQKAVASGLIVNAGAPRQPVYMDAGIERIGTATEEGAIAKNGTERKRSERNSTEKNGTTHTVQSDSRSAIGRHEVQAFHGAAALAPKASLPSAGNDKNLNLSNKDIDSSGTYGPCTPLRSPNERVTNRKRYLEPGGQIWLEADGSIGLTAEERAVWEPRFGGTDQLDMVLMEIAGFIRYGGKFDIRVRSNLAKIALEKLHRDQRYLAAAKQNQLSKRPSS